MPSDTKNHETKAGEKQPPHPADTVPLWAEDLAIDIIFLDIHTK